MKFIFIWNKNDKEAMEAIAKKERTQLSSVLRKAAAEYIEKHKKAEDKNESNS